LETLKTKLLYCRGREEKGDLIKSRVKLQ
jgi:hypothetical protein